MDILHNAMENVRDARKLGPRFVLHRLARRTSKSGSAVRAPIRGVGDVLVRVDSLDLNVVRAIFREDQYRIAPPQVGRHVDAAYRRILDRGRTPLIIDAGANNGASAMWFCHTYPRARVVAVEPDPANAAVCRTNTAPFDVHVLEAAIGSRHGTVTLTTADGASDATRSARDESGEVPIVTVSDILTEQADECELFIVKVDIEGFEADLFAADTDWLDAVSVLYVEPHDYLFPGQGTTRALQTVTARHAFELHVLHENLVYIRP